MTVAAMEAMALRDCLDTGNEQLAQRFFKQANKIIDMAWSIATVNDLSISEAKATMPAPMRFINWYMGKLQIAARYDSVVALAFMKVANLMASPASVLHPLIALRVLCWNLLLIKRPRPIESEATPELTRS